MPDLRFLTLNCQNSFNKANLYNYLSPSIASGKYQIIFLQEISADLIQFIETQNSKEFQFILHSNRSIGILVKNDFTLLDTLEITFDKGKKVLKRKFGAIIVKLESKQYKQSIIACSTHFHASLHLAKRIKAAHEVKEAILKEVDNNSLVVLGGDFNTIFKFEKYLLDWLLQPEFFNLTKEHKISFLGHKIEPVNFQNRLISNLSKLGLKFNRKLDHIYLTNHKNYKTSSRLINAEASDHLPIEAMVVRKLEN